MRLYYCYFMVLLTTVLMTSCAQNESCRENKTVTLNAAFFTSETMNNLTVDSLTAYGMGQGALIYDNEKNIKDIHLPLNKKEEQSTFIMNFNAEQDTVWVLYTNQNYFISYECGAVITHKIDTIITTNHYISSIKILDHDINTTDVQHLQIFH